MRDAHFISGKNEKPKRFFYFVSEKWKSLAAFLKSLDSARSPGDDSRGGKIELSFIQQLSCHARSRKKSRAYEKKRGQKGTMRFLAAVARNDGLRAARRVEPGLIVH